MLSAGLKPGQTHWGTGKNTWSYTFVSGKDSWLLFISVFIFISSPQTGAWPYDYRHLYNNCPGPEWSIMCRGCCEYDVIRCKCPIEGTQVGYAVPCCRNAINECDPCIIHPGCSVFENCKRCNNGTWNPKDDFFVSGKYCTECRPGWSGGDCMKCGGVIRKKQGHLVLESYPNNARCEWTIQVDRPFTVELKFMMLSLESHPSCRYDFVEVRDGDSIRSRVIGRFCGNSRPPPIQSSGNSLHLLFESDGYKNFDGFFATFQESSACSSSPCLHDGTCILDSSYTFHCACLAGYTGKRCEHVVGCRRPPVPTHGSTQGVFLHSGARISFHCDPGFELKGFPSAVCLNDGTWSAPAPSCVPEEKVCALPPKPKHGDHFLVYGPNDVIIALQYLCYQPYELSGPNQRTCLPNNTWSGIPPTCTKVNNTLIETEDKPNAKDLDKAKDIGDTLKPNKTRDIDRENTPRENESGESKNVTSSNENATPIDGDKQPTPTEEKPVEKDRDEKEPEEREGLPEKPTGSSRDTDGGEDSENSMNTVEPKVQEGTKQPDTNTDNEDKELTDPVVVNKGQDEEQRKDKQVNGKKDRDKVGPNDTKLTRVTSQAENTVEIFQIEISKNSTVLHTVKPKNNTIGSSDTDKKSISTRLNVTQYTLYRAGGEGPVKAKEKTTVKDEKTAETTAKKAEDMGKGKEKEEKKKEKDKEENQSFIEKSCPPLPRLHHGYHRVVPDLEPQTVELICNHSYVLSGDARRTCQPDGTWSGKQPLCLRACREPKVSELVKQRVLPPQTPFRKSPVLRLYSSVLAPQLQSDSPTLGPPSVPQLPPGYHQLYTHIEYECASAFYHHSGSPRRTCLKTGKWSGRHVSCSPVCGKHPTFDQERPADSHWPWLAAIYRRSSNGMKTKVTKADSLARSPKKDAGAVAGHHHTRTSDWVLVCSGALVNQRSVVVAAHCMTELGKVYPLDTVKIKVVVGKHHRDDQRDSKGLQHLRVASIVVHPNYDPNILDSDIAVVKLLDKARIGERVLPICLSAIQEEEVASGQGLVTGWSPLPDPQLGTDEKARVGLVHLADVVPCEQQYARNGVPVSVTDNMLCAGEKPDYGTSNICPSDTGGILVSPAEPDNQGSQGTNTGLWRLLGLVSFGYDEGECDPGLYTVYTRVSNFKDWIESNMK